MVSKTVGTTTVTARDWKKNGQHRIYFTINKGQACWDVISSEWIKTHHEFGSALKLQVKAAFDLPYSESERSYLERIGQL